MKDIDDLKNSHKKSKYIFFTVLILLSIILFSLPFFDINRFESLYTLSYEEFAKKNSIEIYSGNYSIFEVMKIHYGEPLVNNRYFQVYEDKNCQDNCTEQKIILNKKKNTIMICDSKNEKK
jgi:hypothetical protein